MFHIISVIFILALLTAQGRGQSDQDVFSGRAISFLYLSEVRIDWWKQNFRQSGNLSECWFFQPTSGYFVNCRLSLSPSQVFGFEERHVLRDLPSIDQKAAIRARTSLYVEPLPYIPPFLSSRYLTERKGAHRSLPVQFLIDSSSQIDTKDLLRFLLSNGEIEFGLNLSFEDVSISEGLRAGWAYWSNVLAKGRFCHRELDRSECMKAIRVESAGIAGEPKGFIRGIAVCRTNEDQTLFFNCTMVSLELHDGRKMVKAFVGSPMIMGGGGELVDSFGVFALECNVPRAQLAGALKRLEAKFGLEGQYKLAPDVEIIAYSAFQHFDRANRWGRFKMEVRHSYSSDKVRFLFNARWWQLNNDDVKRMPSFDDGDVRTFKPIFEAEIGNRVTCSIALSPSVIRKTRQNVLR